MLILTKDGRPLQAPGDITIEESQTMIDGGEAVAVTRLQVNRDIRFASGEVTCSICASTSARCPTVVEVPKECPEIVAKSLLDPEYRRRDCYVLPHVEVLDKFKQPGK